VLAWTHNNVPGFYRREEYRHDFGLNLNQRWRTFNRNKQAKRWTDEQKVNYFDLQSQISVKQVDPDAMKNAITKLKKITTPLFEFYQRACFNRMNFWLYKRRQRGLEKIAQLLILGRKPTEERKWSRGQRKKRKKRKKKIKKRWIPIHKAWKEIQEKKKKEEEEKKKNEEKEEHKQKGKKNKEKKQLLPERKKKKRIATAKRRKRKKKELKPREPSMDVDANNYPAPVVETSRSFLLCEQIASLSSSPNGYEEGIKEIKDMIEPPPEEKINKKQEKPKKEKVNSKQIEIKVLKLKKQLTKDFNEKKEHIWQNEAKREEARRLFMQLNKKGQNTTVTSAPLPLESGSESQMPKRLVIAFGAAKFATRGVPREKIKTFLRGKKIPVYEVNEFYTSQKCAECGEVKKKKKRSQIVSIKKKKKANNRGS